MKTPFVFLILCLLFAGSVPSAYAQKKQESKKTQKSVKEEKNTKQKAEKVKKAPEKKETLAKNPFSKVQEEIKKLAKLKPQKFSQRRKQRNRLDYLQKKLAAHLERRLEPLERKVRHLEGRLLIPGQEKRKKEITKQINDVKKEIELNKNTADLEGYQAMIKEAVSRKKDDKSSSKSEKRSKKSRKSKKSKK